MTLFRRFFILCCAIFLTLFVGSPRAATLESSKQPQLASVSQWNFGLALGFGKQQNIILGQSDLNIYLVPTVSYYGQKWFFDNGTLGYSFIEKPKYALSVVTEINPFSAQYYDYHPLNVFLFDSSVSNDFSDAEASQDYSDIVNDVDAGVALPSQPLDSRDDEQQKIETNLELTKPQWSIDLGLQHNWFISNRYSIISKIFTDISNVHNGKRADINFSYRYQLRGDNTFLANWQFNFQFGLSMLSRQTTQYFYGIDERHIHLQSYQYRTDSAINKTVRMSLRKPITNKLNMILYWKKEFLDDTIAHSPRVTSAESNTYFMGLLYAF